MMTRALCEQLDEITGSGAVHDNYNDCLRLIYNSDADLPRIRSNGFSSNLNYLMLNSQKKSVSTMFAVQIFFVLLLKQCTVICPRQLHYEILGSFLVCNSDTYLIKNLRSHKML